MFWKYRSTSDLLYKTTLLLSLIILLVSSWDAPMSGDEYVHVKQAEKNINYLKTFGGDKEALDTPISRLKHYGQSFDTITTYVAQVLHMDDLYRFRHISNAFVAWLIILFTSLIVLKISEDKMAGFITIILFLVSMRFMGHAMNNLKDIPFAFAFIFSFYFIFRFLEKLPDISWADLIFLTLGIAFGISIRIGGLLIFGYFILFSGLYYYYLVVSHKLDKKQIFPGIWKLGAISISMFLLSYFLGILIWPWALEDPISHPKESLELMHNYATTIRQVFEGKLYWSDQFPWYYLFKYMLITLPIIVLAGFGLFLILVRKIKDQKGIIFSIFILLAFGFPLFYTSASGANVYGGWRQLLFVFPPFVVLSAIGIWLAFEKVQGYNRYIQTAGILVAMVLVINPVRFFLICYPYQYTFFNPLAGGTSGAYGHYELDYYFTSFKKAYQFIDQQIDDDPGIIAANFIIPEYYKGKNYTPKLIDYYNRSSEDWDYAVICNTFLDPFQLRNGYWPPSNTIFSIEIEGKPILAILKRNSKLDLEGKELLVSGHYRAAIDKLTQALEMDRRDESIRLNLARAYLLVGDIDAVYTVLNYFEELYPNNEWAKDLNGEGLLKQGKIEEAMTCFEQNIDYNYKFFHSYVNLARAYVSLGEEENAISLLKTCLRINPFYTPAYQLYGSLLVDRGETELGNKMLEYSISGDSKYGRE